MLHEMQTPTMKFLIVEDNDNMRRVIKSLISELGGETHECCDGAEALAAYAEHFPDWVLMDIEMTEMDGIAATRQIKTSFPNANIMIITDYDNQDLRRLARDAGATEYVAKENLFDMCRILSLSMRR
jgi:CheY-like chemotaxis protein